MYRTRNYGYALCVAAGLSFAAISLSSPAQVPPQEAGATSSQAPEKSPTQGPLPTISPDARYDFQGEATFILQSVTAFHSPYSGTNSFQSRNEAELSHTYELYLGARLLKNLEVYVDPELALGNGLSSGFGLGGYTNGDIIGQPTLRPDPFLARYFVRWRVPMKHVGTHAGGEQSNSELTGRAPNVIAGQIPAHRLVIQAGKFAISDVFDVNSYANNPRTQFMNKSLNNNAAYDFAQETRGFDLGTSIAWINPTFAVRFGTFAMPTFAGGPDLAYNFNNQHSEQLEVELHPQALRLPKPPLIVRLLTYRNVGSMGRYANALAELQPGGLPNISTASQPGTVKYGFGINMEQALADGGDTGLFARLGWSDGSIESFAFAEADDSQSLGIQLSGVHWRRKNDRVGAAIVQNEISTIHQSYLAQGGLGFSLGDGALHYSPERIVEIYYSYQVNKPISMSLDYQFIGNPGYNQDRGPVSVLAIRAHAAF